MGTPVYPASKKTYADKEDFVDVYEAAHINSLQDEVQAIEEELGTDVAGSKTDLKTRLAVCLEDDGTVQHGTSFPGSPATGQAFYRTDEDRFYIYNSSWISVEQLSNLAFCISGGSSADTPSGQVSSAVGSSIYDCSSSSPVNYVWSNVSQNSHQTVTRTYYKHISSVTTVRCYIHGRCENVTYGTCQINIGGQTQSGALSTSVGWINFDVDVSGLTGDTYYEVLCQILAGGGFKTQVGAFVGIAIA